MKKYLHFLIFLLISSVLILGLKDEWQKKIILERQKKDLELQIKALEEEYQKLKVLLEKGRREEFLEREARLMLGLKKIGEKVMIVIPPKSFSETANLAEIKNKKQQTFFYSTIDKLKIWYQNIIEKIK